MRSVAMSEGIALIACCVLLIFNQNFTIMSILKGDRVLYAGAVYNVAEIKKFPHGEMIGIYDEPPSQHVDYINPKNCKKLYACNNCQGNGCPTCNGFGLLFS